MNFPENLKYSKEHEWISVSGDEATVGISEFAQGELGDIVFVDIDTKGQTIDVDGIFGTIEAVKTVSDLFLPVTGEILEVNPLLNNQPELINTHSYGDGWIVKIKISDPSQLASLMDATTYREHIGL